MSETDRAIETEFQRIVEGASDTLTGYLIGGATLSLCTLRGATRNIDLAVPSGGRI